MATNALAMRGELLPAREAWETMLNMAGELVKSGLLPNAIRTPAAALAIIQTGQELGLPPMYALRKIAVINGSPVVEAEVMLAMIYRDHGDNAVVFDETNSERCTIRYKRKGWDKYQTFSWTIEEAEAAKLTQKDVWKMYRPAMLRARCISAMARLAFPDTVGGMYLPEEMGAEVEVRNGEIVVVDRPKPVVSIVASPNDVTSTIAPEPADDVTRAKFEANWTKGTARAIAAGIAPDEKPGPDATRAQLNKAQRELLEAIQVREKLNAEFAEKTSQVITAGGDVAAVDPATCTDTEIHEMLATLNEMLAAAPDDEAF